MNRWHGVTLEQGPSKLHPVLPLRSENLSFPSHQPHAHNKTALREGRFACLLLLTWHFRHRRFGRRGLRGRFRRRFGLARQHLLLLCLLRRSLLALQLLLLSRNILLRTYRLISHAFQRKIGLAVRFRHDVHTDCATMLEFSEEHLISQWLLDVFWITRASGRAPMRSS